MNADGKRYHAACFTCCKCGSLLTSFLFDGSGNLYCDRCSSCASSPKPVPRAVGSPIVKAQSFDMPSPSTPDKTVRTTMAPKPAERPQTVAPSKAARKEGYMKKQGGQIKTWKKRWFVLENGSLSYFKSKNVCLFDCLFDQLKEGFN